MRSGPYSDFDLSDAEFQRAVSRFLAAKDQNFAVSGSIPIPEGEPMNLFFRTTVSAITSDLLCIWLTRYSQEDPIRSPYLPSPIHSTTSPRPSMFSWRRASQTSTKMTSMRQKTVGMTRRSSSRRIFPFLRLSI